MESLELRILVRLRTILRWAEQENNENHKRTLFDMSDGDGGVRTGGLLRTGRKG